MSLYFSRREVNCTTFFIFLFNSLSYIYTQRDSNISQCFYQMTTTTFFVQWALYGAMNKTDDQKCWWIKKGDEKKNTRIRKARWELWMPCIKNINRIVWDVLYSMQLRTNFQLFNVDFWSRSNIHCPYLFTLYNIGDMSLSTDICIAMYLKWKEKKNEEEKHWIFCKCNELIR